jgi:RNA polymerase sigma factor (sigma-70 family)
MALIAKKKSGFTRKYDWLGDDDVLKVGEKVLSDKQQKLVEGMYPACWHLANTLTPRHLKDPETIEISYERALNAVFRSAHGFDETYGIKFCTYAYGSASRAVWSYWANKKERTTQDLKFVQLYDANGNNQNMIEVFVPDPRQQKMIEDAESRLDLERIKRPLELLEQLHPRWYRVVVAYKGLDDGRPKTNREIAEEFGLSKQRINQMYNLGIKFLREAIRLIELGKK